MTSPVGRARLLRMFATLADTLHADYDVVELMQTLVDACQELLDATDAGILLVTPAGELELLASTSESSRLVGVLHRAAEAGPGIECFRTAAPISVPRIGDTPARWAAFRAAAADSGYGAIDVIPMRLRDTTIGVLTLLRTETGAADPDDLVAAGAFADVATIGILHERTATSVRVVTRRLQTALDTRVVIEQAKGAVSSTAGVPVETAFLLLRAHARSRRLALSDVAARVVRRELRIALPSPP